MNKFQNKVNKLLEADEYGEDIAMSDSDLLAQASEGGDPSVAVNPLDIDPNVRGVEDQAEDIKEWVMKLSEIADWLSGMNGDSLTQNLNELDVDGGPYDGISGENKKISRISEDILGVSETLKRYYLESTKRAPAQPAPTPEPVEEF